MENINFSDESAITPNTPISELMHMLDDDTVDSGPIDNEDELQHWGIRGMKWGVRRYQNKDGSLTAAGQKRRDKLQSELDKIDGKEGSKNSGKTSKKIKDMSDEELQAYITRKNSERMAYTLERDISALNPKKVSTGKKLAEAIEPGMKEASRKMLSALGDKISKKIIGDGDDAMSALKKEAEKAGYNKIIAEAKKAAEQAKQEEWKTKEKESKAAQAAKSEDSTSSKKKSSLFSRVMDTKEQYDAESNAAANRRKAAWETNQDEYDFDTTVVDDDYKSSLSVSAGRSYLSSSRVSGLLSSPASNISGYLPAPKDDD